MTITKADLINRIHATHPNLTNDKARESVETILRIIKSRLEDGENVLLSGFGKFKIRDKWARRGRNPQTGDSLMLDARRVVTFKPSGKLRDRLNKK